VHTSTVTVSVLNPESIDINEDYQKISDGDFRVEWFSGSGAGGQHRNKKMNSCRFIHIPTGIMESRQGRKREDNLRQAKDAILKRLQEMQYSDRRKQSQDIKKTQAGSGMRGDKIRTYRFQDNYVVDHITGKSAKANKVMKGNFNLLW
jgi:peptide chain release factor 1